MKLFLFILFSTLAFAQPQLSVSAGTTPVKVWPTGQRSTMSIALSGSAGQNIAATQFTISIPAGSTVTATAGAASTAAGKSLACGPVLSGTMICIVYGLNANLLGDGDVADLSIALSPGTVPASLAFTLSGTLSASVDGTAVTTAAGPAVNVPVANPCDLNGDGKVDITDLTGFVGQATGMTACTTGDLIGLGACDVRSAQRIVEAALGNGCKVGQ